MAVIQNFLTKIIQNLNASRNIPLQQACYNNLHVICIPTKWDLMVQLSEANPPKIPPFVSLTTMSTGPWLLIWWINELKLSPWIWVENKSRHWCCNAAGRWWFISIMDGTSKSGSILSKSASNLHGIIMCDLKISKFFKSNDNQTEATVQIHLTFRVTFTANSKREIVTRDQVFPWLVPYCL